MFFSPTQIPPICFIYQSAASKRGGGLEEDRIYKTSNPSKHTSESGTNLHAASGYHLADLGFQCLPHIDGPPIDPPQFTPTAPLKLINSLTLIIHPLQPALQSSRPPFHPCYSGRPGLVNGLSVTTQETLMFSKPTIHTGWTAVTSSAPSNKRQNDDKKRHVRIGAAAPAKQKPLPFHQSFIAGGIAGLSELAVMYPLDVIKTRAQLQVGGAGQPFVATLVNTIKTEKFGIYRGILAPAFVEAPKRAIKFGANEIYKPMFTNKDGVLTTAGSIGAGVATGLSEALVVSTPEMLKIRCQAIEYRGVYSGPGDAFVKILRTEGPMALTKGLEATLWRHGVWNGGYFGSVHIVRSALPKPETDGGTLAVNFVAGAISGTIGTMLNTPPDVLKSRIQNSPSNVVPWAPIGIYNIARKEGIRAIYKGFIPKVARLGPGGGVMLVIFDAVSKFFRRRNAEAEAAAERK